MAGSGALRAVMDEGIDAMPSWLMGCHQIMAPLHPAAPTSTSNAFRMMMGYCHKWNMIIR
jgi:hypothetical protein